MNCNYRYSSRVRGFTLIELLITVAIIAILITILIPAIAMAKERSRRGTCINNLSQIGKAIFMYAQENNDNLPLTADDSRNDIWNGTNYLIYGQLLVKQQVTIQDFYCPAAKVFNPDNSASGYQNVGVLGTDNVTRSSYYQRGAPQGAPKQITFDEPRALISDMEIRDTGDLNYSTNHGEGVNTLYLDAHVLYVEIPPQVELWRSDYVLAGGDQLDMSGNVVKIGSWTQLDRGKTEPISP